MKLDKLLEIPFSWDNRRSILDFLPKEVVMKFAIFCAEQVIDLFEDEHPDDSRPRKAIETAKLFLEGKVTTKDCSIAAHAAYDAYDAARAAYADARAARAARAAHAAAAHAAYADDAAAAYAASAYASYAAAAYAASAYAASAYAGNPELTKQEQMNYLRNLILENLTEEQKDNWLLVASI